MDNRKKKWIAIFTSSLIAATVANMSAFLSPITIGAIMATCVLTGATYATMFELKEDMKRKQEVVQRPKPQLPTRSIEDIYRTLLHTSETWEIDLITNEMKSIYEKACYLSQSTHQLTEEEQHFVSVILFKDLYYFFHAFSQFPSSEKEQKQNEMIEMLQRVDLKLSEIYNNLNQRKEKEFELQKNLLQEKLKKY